MTNHAVLPPRDPQDFGWLIDNFATSTPGVSHALIVSADGLPLITAGGMSPDLADPLAAMTSGIISLGNNIASKVGQAGCDQVMLKFPAGHFLFMSIGTLAGFAVLAADGANLGVIAHQMAQLVDAVGHVLTPQLRDDLRRLNAMSGGVGRPVTINPWVRPYVLTGGRTRTRHDLFVHTLVTVERYDSSDAMRMSPEARRLYERAALGPQSVAELSAHCGVSLGVTRVLLEDLAAADRVQINDETYASPYDHQLLKRVIDGLREFA